MKALLVITGRGMGGDAVNALNIARALEDNGVECELALDPKAPGLIFKKNGYDWYKISIPQAGGHAATKIATIKAAFRTLKAGLQARKLIKKSKTDVVVGIIGGGAVVGAIGAKIAKTPSVSIIDTPLDTKVCTRLNNCIVLPEAKLFREDIIPNNVIKSFFPLTTGLTKGNKEVAIKNIRDRDKNKLFDPSKPSILFSSGSSLFEMMAKAVSNYTYDSSLSDHYNLFLVGIPLEEDYLSLIDTEKVINLGYIDWIRDLYDLIDLAVLTDDGVMIQEAMACELPAIALTRVKYGRYHNMAGIFPGAVIESDLEDLNTQIEESLKNLDEIKNNAKKYSNEVTSAGDKIAKFIINEVNKDKK
ncbi:glycosyltransferase [Methanobrevibacter filiformis]|uniref:UDP-N-acetylglucosamine--N-acetylmuramyl-(Pentapeptide) N-acetylglucosamine transferase n=1 Tax=Methanobrevibacter filiformis TaxID=55758 RepID=A0A166F045_9EURY|nr:glycosyltransferase [Methanobrevibacter filiformis]KZX17186.1 UDP-N-acetylglucosamine--N-acetylmuramyl-(pentapeptide) N-acetylglucosamine transferase [Methanobrevibacter filiformis]